MNPHQHYSSFCSSFNDDDDQFAITNFSEEEISEIMLSFVANQNDHSLSLATTNPNTHYAANYYGYNNDEVIITGGANICTPNILNTTPSSSCSSESDLGLSPPMADRAVLLNNIASGIINNAMTTSFDVGNCYQPAAANYTPSAPVAGGDNYHGTTTTTQLCNNNNNNNNNNDVKVGQYTAEERKDRIMKYLKKRNQRNFNKTIKYACRKTLADRRVRVRGRFARNSNELSEEDITAAAQPQRRPSENDDGHQDNQSSYIDNGGTHVGQMMRREEEDDEDQWLQEAMASLLYAPNYIAAG